jgi:hypothetical protein
LKVATITGQLRGISDIFTNKSSSKLAKIFCFQFQLRVDFNTFVIAGPNTNAVSVGTTLNGEVADPAIAQVFSTVTQVSINMTLVQCFDHC